MTPNLPKILSMYRLGATTSRICLTFGLSETRYYEFVRKHPEKFKSAKKMRLMAQKKKSKSIRERHLGPIVEVVKSQKKITSEEKVAQLERKLELERKKNAELEKLLNVAKEFLGKL